MGQSSDPCGAQRLQGLAYSAGCIITPTVHLYQLAVVRTFLESALEPDAV